MAAHLKKVLRAAAAITTSTTTVTPAQMVSVHSQEIIAVSTVSARTDGTYTVTLQHSGDGVTWFDLVACAAQSANGSVVGTVASTVTHFLYMRASIVSATVTSGATVAVDLYYGEQRM